MLNQCTPSQHDVTEAAAGSVPLVRQHAAQTERKRFVDADVVERLRDDGLYRLFVPKCFGGYGW